MSNYQPTFNDIHVSDETIIDGFETGKFTFTPMMYSLCLPSHHAYVNPGNNFSRRTLFEYFVKKGYPFSDGNVSEMNFIASAGMDWLRFVVENFPRQLTKEDFGSAVCNVATDKTLAQLQYFTEQTKADIFWWGAAYYACATGSVKALVHCMLNGFPIRRDYCYDTIMKRHPELLKDEIVYKYFMNHDDLEGRIKTIYLMDNIY